MAGATCDISSIYNHCLTTLYPPVQSHLVSAGMLLSQDNDKSLSFAAPEPSSDLTVQLRSWTQHLPNFWSREEVLEWFSYNIEKNSWDASTIDLTQCEMDGQHLCQLSREDMTQMFGGLGDKLYDHLCQLKKNEWHTAPMCDSRFGDEDWINLLDGSSNLELIFDLLGNPDNLQTAIKIERDDFGYQTPDSYFYPISPASSESCESGTVPYSPQGDSAASDLDIKVNHNVARDIFSSKTDVAPKKRRGRPRKLNSDCRDFLETKKSKHSRGTHLWEFIRDILLHPDKNNGLLKWEDRTEGVFKFLRSEAVAQLWGEKKKNGSMTYEKLSRAMRYYYKREILERVDGRRLVYKFGKNSSGWQLGDKSSHAC